MDSDRWQQLKSLFDDALRLDAGKRAEFLSKACANDEVMRREVEALLASYASAGSFIEQPAAERIASMILDQKALLVAGQRVAHYEIIETLGKGGMGEVYLAQDTRLKRKVALKLLPAELTDNKERLQRFEQEARAVSALNHPNILTIYEIGVSDDLNFIATEFIDGVTWRQIMREGASLLEILDVATQVASALATAHEAGIVHRDIKPENVMLRRDGIVKVLDFGLAKTFTTPDSKTAADAPTLLVETGPGVVMGTMLYMSPEQARGTKIDARADVWSLGAVLYEVLAGRLPFAGETPSDVIASILKTQPPPLKQLSPNVPDELQRIVNKTLRHDKEERYQSAKDLFVDLKNLKQELEFAAKLERTAAPDPARKEVADQAQSAFTHATMITTPISEPRVTSSAEYIVTQLKGRHKQATLVALVVLIVGVSALGYFLMRNRDGNDAVSAAVIDSLAVLPFANTSQDPNAEYLSDGITESLINTLSQLPSLRVLSRSAVFRYKGQDVDAKRVGSELNVRAVLKGGVKQLGDQLVINVELIDARDNRQIWGEQYVRKFADVLTLQRSIVQEVSGKLRLKLTSSEQKLLARQTTDNAEAYRLYLKGRYQATKMTRESFDKSVEYLRQAINLDPGYALAYSGLAYYYIGTVDQILSPKEAMTKAREAAQKALALDDTLVEAHVSMAYVYWQYDWDWTKAEQEFKRALELNPNNGEAHSNYGFFLALMGRFDEGIAEGHKGRDLSPLSLEADFNLAPSYYFARRYDEAIDNARKTIELAPDFWLPHLIAGRAYEQKRQLPAAIAEYQKARKIDSDTPEALMDLGRAYGLSGQRTEAEQVLNELKARTKTAYVSPFQIAMVYIGLGDKEQAFAALEQSYEARTWYMTWLKNAPEFDSLREDPRFADLVRRVGL